MMDQNKPARFLDTAYNALKANPGATNQILQAAAQGQPVGLRGLAAAAAQQSQQEAQKAAAAQQMQGPQPTVMQKLAMESMPGIMGQLPSSLQLASAPTAPAPEEMPPQMMAGGGLVSFAEGGGVLPPDVIDAIQSHFAYGGEVRGFPVGGPVEMEDDILRKVFAGGRDPRNFAQSERMKEIIARNADNPAKDQIEDIIRRMVEGPPADVEPSTYSQRGVRSTLTLPGETPPPSPDADLNSIRQQNYMRQITGNAPVETPAYGQRATRSLFTPPEGLSSVSPDADIGKAIQEAHMRNITGNAPEPSAYQMRSATQTPSYTHQGTPATNPRAPLDVRSLSSEAEAYLAKAGQGLEELAPVAKKGMGYLKYLNLVGDVAMALTPSEALAANSDTPSYYPGEGLSPSEAPGSFLTRAEDFAPTGMYNPEKAITESRNVKGDKAAPQPTTWKPEAHDGHEVNPKARVTDEGAKVDKKFEQTKTDTGSAAATPDSKNLGGLNTIAPGMDMEKMRDLIMGLGGHKELSPELSQQLGDLKDSARNSTILQSVLGALGGGLTDPYGGRFALGRAALGALGGYQKGVGSEEEIGRKAFDVLRGYADAPAEEQTKARDLLIGQLGKSAELESEERRAALRAGSGLSVDERKELALFKAGITNPYQQTQMAEKQQLARDRASDNAMRDIENENKRRTANVLPELTLAEKEAIIKQHFAMQGVPYIGGLGAQQSAGQSGGLGGGPLVLK